MIHTNLLEFKRMQNIIDDHYVPLIQLAFDHVQMQFFNSTSFKTCKFYADPSLATIFCNLQRSYYLASHLNIKTHLGQASADYYYPLNSSFE
jgi:hypothetical protein